jgi:Tripartite tricarboxylate transporter family receptor
MNYGTTGVGSDDHLLMLGLEGLAGLQPMTHAPFAGSAPLLAQVLGGHIELGVGNMRRTCRPFASRASTWSRVPRAASPGRRGCRRRSAPSWNKPSPRRWPIPPSCGKRSASSCRSGHWWGRPWSS